MNKKGFTLVELLVVVVVLGLIAIVLVPIIQDTLNKSKNKINSINIKQVEDAGKIVAEEILYCDINSAIKIVGKDEYKYLLNLSTLKGGNT